MNLQKQQEILFGDHPKKTMHLKSAPGDHPDSTFGHLATPLKKYYYFSPKGATRLMKLEILICAFGDTSNEILRFRQRPCRDWAHV